MIAPKMFPIDSNSAHLPNLVPRAPAEIALRMSRKRRTRVSTRKESENCVTPQHFSCVPRHLINIQHETSSIPVQNKKTQPKKAKLGRNRSRRSENKGLKIDVTRATFVTPVQKKNCKKFPWTADKEILALIYFSKHAYSRFSPKAIMCRLLPG